MQKPRRRLVVSSRMVRSDERTAVRRTDVYEAETERTIIVERAYAAAPVLAVNPRAVRDGLDSRSAFLLTLIDGTTSIETLLDICAMPRDQAMSRIDDLIERGIVVLRPRHSIPPTRQSISPRKMREPDEFDP